MPSGNTPHRRFGLRRFYAATLARMRDLAALLFAAPNRTFSPGVPVVAGGPFGSARLATSADLHALEAQAIADPDQHVRLLEAYMIGHDPRPEVSPTPGLPLPLGVVSPNLLVVGRSGSGKTEKVVLPAIAHAIEAGWTTCVINVKGRRQTAVLRRITTALGRQDQWRLIAPRSPDRTLGYNPVTDCKSIKRASWLAESIVATAGGGSRSDSSAWAYNQAQNWLKFAILAIANDPQGSGTLVDLRAEILAGTFASFAARYPEYPYLGRFATYVAENNNGSTIAETITEVTSFIDDVAPFLSAAEIDLPGFVKSGGVLVVEIDEGDMDDLRVLTTILAGHLIHTLQTVARGGRDGRLPHKTMVAIDELAAAGSVRGLTTVLHTCRDMALSFVAGTQTVAQLPAIYGPTTGEIVAAGFQTKIALGGALDPASAEYFSRASGMTSTFLPNGMAPESEDGDVTVVGGWQIIPRPLLLPGDIANPLRHPQLDHPATIFVGDGGTPPFQAYLTPAWAHGGLGRIMEEAASAPADEDRRKKPLASRDPGHRPGCLPARLAPPPFYYGGTGGISADRLRQQVAALTKAARLDDAPLAARSWWRGLERTHKDSLPVLHELLEFLRARNATIAELHDARRVGQTDDPAALLPLVDFIQARARGKRNEEPPRPSRKPERDTNDELNMKSLLEQLDAIEDDGCDDDDDDDDDDGDHGAKKPDGPDRSGPDGPRGGAVCDDIPF